jgi:Cys-tRNA(Pro)/Cys-tRNA(Cys) deacylase
VKELAEKHIDKTNAVRQVENAGYQVTVHAYQADAGAVDGLSVAAKTGRSPEQVFKTLVTVGPDREPYVFVLPVAAELDLKKAALAAGVKRIEMLPLQEITRATGYLRGGCSPVAMKKDYATYLAEEAILWETILVSAGQIGLQMEIAPANLIAVTRGDYADITRA